MRSMYRCTGRVKYIPSFLGQKCILLVPYTRPCCYYGPCQPSLPQRTVRDPTYIPALTQLRTQVSEPEFLRTNSVIFVGDSTLSVLSGPTPTSTPPPTPSVGHLIRYYHRLVSTTRHHHSNTKLEITLDTLEK